MKMRRTLVLTAVLVVLLSFGLAIPASGTEPPPPPTTEYNPCIDLVKTGPATASPGETITYHYWVENCGDLPLVGGYKVYDPLIGPDWIWDSDLIPDAVEEFDMPYTLPDDDCGPFVNDAWAIGKPRLPDGNYLPDVRDDSSWTVDIICEPPPDGEGCTPGYWKQQQHFDSWSVAPPGGSFSDVFGVDYDKTLLEALKTGGGGKKALGRHAAAAYLNALSGDVAYSYSVEEIIAIVQEAYATGEFEAAKDQLEAQNEPTFCPLN